jgi:hypothetical protein
MSNVYLLYGNDTTAQQMNNAISERYRQCSNPIYIAASYGLKNLRIENNPAIFSEENILTIGEFDRKVCNQVYKRNGWKHRLDVRGFSNRA